MLSEQAIPRLYHFRVGSSISSLQISASALHGYCQL